MKKNMVLALSALLMLSSCGSYTGSGAYAGATFGSILGSAIGGLSDGPRGSDLGTIIGMAGGAAIGASIGSAADKQRAADLAEYRHDKAERAAARRQRQQQSYSESSSASRDSYSYSQSGSSSDSGFDASNSGDDRIYDFTSSDYTGSYSAQQPRTSLPGSSSVEDIAQRFSYSPSLEVVNARFVDNNEDGKITRGEICKVIFEVMNRSNKVLYDVVPTVVETTGNKHIYISPSLHVEKIAPGKGIRYTALVKADNRLKDGTVRICVSVLQGDKTISKVTEFNIPTAR